MGKKTDKLQRVVEKLASRYGEQDEDVQRLQSALVVLQAAKLHPVERRHFGTPQAVFLTPAKRIYYASPAGLTQ
jgi:hypothetical protein